MYIESINSKRLENVWIGLAVEEVVNTTRPHGAKIWTRSHPKSSKEIESFVIKEFLKDLLTLQVHLDISKMNPQNFKRIAGHNALKWPENYVNVIVQEKGTAISEVLNNVNQVISNGISKARARHKSTRPKILVILSNNTKNISKLQKKLNEFFSKLRKQLWLEITFILAREDGKRAPKVIYHDIFDKRVIVKPLNRSTVIFPDKMADMKKQNFATIYPYKSGVDFHRCGV